jgi:hypothetical protein
MVYILSIDQGTSSTRCLLFNEDINIISSYQLEHQQIYRQSGWVEHDPIEIWNNVQICINRSVESVLNAGLEHKIMSIGQSSRGFLSVYTIYIHRCLSIGITNQRETCLFWHKSTGQPYAPAIVWNDTRTANVDCDCILLPIIIFITRLLCCDRFVISWLRNTRIAEASSSINGLQVSHEASTFVNILMLTFRLFRPSNLNLLLVEQDLIFLSNDPWFDA